ncbi:MAG TPA: translation elongation factor Ts [Candidatus Hydrogenedentes bacterium]|nr:translation elongation factor Ts [Candidatus Hydrogenedentota bacterium]
MSISAKDVKDLREKSGAGMMDCKKALTECDGNVEAAIVWLREKGMASAAKRAGRTASEGAVTSYIHMGGKMGVLVEINCETDFVARGEKFQELSKNICLQICSMPPQWIRREDVPADVIEAEKQVYVAQMKETPRLHGKPENILEKIAEGKMGKFFEDNCLLEQGFVKEPKTKIEDLIKLVSGTVGEKIDVRRFERFVLGEGIEAAPEGE